MQLKSLSIRGFLGKEDDLDLRFHHDLNIITGYNGAGKTNLLKVLWYAVSGNFSHLLEEVQFDEFTLETSKYTIFVRKHAVHTCSGWFEQDGQRQDVYDVTDEERGFNSDARDVFKELTQVISGSIFFPTFRRIEGGFSIGGTEKQRGGTGLFAFGRQSTSDLQKSVSDISQRLTNAEHNFVTSISTFDISELLLRRYTALSEASTQIQSKMTQGIIKEIRDFRVEHGENHIEEALEASQVLDDIAEKIERADLLRVRTMAPFNAVKDMISKIFAHKSIQFTKRLSFGDAANAISSDLLSAGEKQMLSFICYNAFFSGIPIFIDEPELSLHVDWQRTLFPTLESQKKSNQFIIATHSPFIYGKYPEKEIALANRRGDELDNA
ncbi:AAA family ATPase [Novosphingopyxis baekryungensis]|uniref:AAA family ATPase n=1 Tax=Novosphingopyxis baekryungensis TaxID=279369 RepID=UPI0003B6BC7B|nr:AAA family ATPase [Novosphingopyxis baekryungensis]